jgi:hypothetical protein
MQQIPECRDASHRARNRRHLQLGRPSRKSDECCRDCLLVAEFRFIEPAKADEFCDHVLSNGSRISVRDMPSSPAWRSARRISSATGSPSVSPQMWRAEASAYSQTASAARRCSMSISDRPSWSGASRQARRHRRQAGRDVVRDRQARVKMGRYLDLLEEPISAYSKLSRMTWASARARIALNRPRRPSDRVG